MKVAESFVDPSRGDGSVKGQRLIDSVGSLSRVLQPWVVIHIYVCKVKSHIGLENGVLLSNGMDCHKVIVIVSHLPVN